MISYGCPLCQGHATVSEEEYDEYERLSAENSEMLEVVKKVGTLIHDFDMGLIELKEPSIALVRLRNAYFALGEHLTASTVRHVTTGDVREDLERDIGQEILDSVNEFKDTQDIGQSTYEVGRAAPRRQK